MNIWIGKDEKSNNRKDRVIDEYEEKGEKGYEKKDKGLGRIVKRIKGIRKMKKWNMVSK